jgi:hypothetical protein
MMLLFRILSQNNIFYPLHPNLRRCSIIDSLSKIKKITEANQRSNDNFERFLLKWDKQQETPAPSHTTSPVPLNSSGLWTNPPCHSNSCLFEGKSFKPAIQDHHTDMAGYGKDNDWRFTDMTSKWHPPRTELNKFDGSGIT